MGGICNLECWKNHYPQLGGMHWAMSFSDGIGKLTANSDLKKVMSCALAGIGKRLMEKKFRMNEHSVSQICNF